MKTFGTVLKKLRKEHSLTQSQLAKKVYKSESAVRMWELGKSQPDNETLKLLSDIFDVSIDYLLGHDVKRNRSTEAYDYERNIQEFDEDTNIMFNDLAGMDEEDILEVKKFIDYIKSKNK